MIIFTAEEGRCPGIPNGIKAGVPIELTDSQGCKTLIYVHDFISNIGINCSKDVTKEKVMERLRNCKNSLLDKVSAILSNNKKCDEKTKDSTTK